MKGRRHRTIGGCYAAVALLVCVFFPSRLDAQTAHLDTLRHFHPRPGTGISGIWGYTAPDGREYALVGIKGSGSGSTSGGTSIVDITVDNNPRLVTHINGPNSTWREMKTYRQYAYVVTEAGGGTQIINLSQLPDTAGLVRSFTYTSGTKNSASSHTISIHDGFMYLNGCAGWSPGGILIFDLRNDPTNPQFVSEYQPMYIHDSYVLRDTIYASAINAGGGLIIADAKNKANVQLINRIAYANSGTHNAWVTKDRRYALTTDEINHPQKNVKIWDISNLPAVPTQPSATFTVDPNSIVHNVHVRGDYVYCAWYNGYGLQIMDITNPTLPTLAAGYRTSTSTSSSNLALETYPYFPSGKIIIGDGSNGLWIFRFSELAPRVPVNLLAPSNGAHVNSSAPISFRWTKSANLAKDPHYYEVRITGSGLDTTWRANDSVSTFSDFARLQNGQTYTWRVTTRDEWNTTPSPQTNQFVYDGPTGVVDQPKVPGAFELEQNYPNPFNPTTRIAFTLPSLSSNGAKGREREGSHVTLKVYDLLGREVATLVNERKEPGNYEVQFDASQLASGVYLYTLKAGGFAGTRKLLILK